MPAALGLGRLIATRTDLLTPRPYHPKPGRWLGLGRASIRSWISATQRASVPESPCNCHLRGRHQELEKPGYSPSCSFCVPVLLGVAQACQATGARDALHRCPRCTQARLSCQPGGKWMVSLEGGAETPLTSAALGPLHCAFVHSFVSSFIPSLPPSFIHIHSFKTELLSEAFLTSGPWLSHTWQIKPDSSCSLKASSLREGGRGGKGEWILVCAQIISNEA